MKKIRSNVFETNSSSVHALCIIKNNTKNIDEVLYNLKKFDKIWDKYKIIDAIDNGNYDDLHCDVKKLLNDIGFNRELASKDSNYTYNLIEQYPDEFNRYSGDAGIVDIDLNVKSDVVNFLFKEYKNLTNDNITFNEFKSQINWENYNFDNIFRISIDCNRYKTINFLKNNFTILKIR